MILVASQRSGAMALADHLMNDVENDHVTVVGIDGFMADDLHEALEEAQAISKATRCKKFLFSVSLNPPEEAIVTDEGFTQAADRIADSLGLTDQPRAMVIHEKNGRRHAHVVWSRIDVETMTAIELGRFKLKLRDLSKELFLDHGWDLPDGLRTYGHKNPLNFTLDEWQHAQRVGIDPRELKQAFHEAWTQSDNLRSLTNALEDRGLYLAKGDRRGFVALDIEGNIYALARWTGIKTKDITARLGSPDDLPSVTDTASRLKQQKTDQVRRYIGQVKDRHNREMRPFLHERTKMVKAQREERADLKAKQQHRWIAETKARQDRLNKGLRGLFDRITGAHRKTKRLNETDALACQRRDQEQRDRLIQSQIIERKALQSRAGKVRHKHEQECKLMGKTVASYVRRPTRTKHRERGIPYGPGFDI